MDTEMIYLSMMGELMDPVPGVENAFAPGQPCACLYQQIFDANRRLCQRLGVDEDEDLDCMIDSFWEINRELCLRMFKTGAGIE